MNEQRVQPLGHASVALRTRCKSSLWDKTQDDLEVCCAGQPIMQAFPAT